MNWIKCSDETPEKGIVCLLYQTYPPETMFNCRADPLARTSIRIGGMRYNDKFVSYEDQYNDKGLRYVTHWMPLPSPPKDEE